MSSVTYEKEKLLQKNPRKIIKKEERGLRKEVIAARKEALINALKVPPALNQFRTYLDDETMSQAEKIFSAFKPETRSQRRARLKEIKEKGMIGPKPIFVKSGAKHVTSLIEQKKAKLVLIACDVDPIEVVLFLPTLCKKMDVPYALVKSRYQLGKLVNRKSSTCVCLCDVDTAHRLQFNDLVKKCNAMFAENYDIVMKEWGQPPREQEA